MTLLLTHPWIFLVACVSWLQCCSWQVIMSPWVFPAWSLFLYCATKAENLSPPQLFPALIERLSLRLLAFGLHLSWFGFELGRRAVARITFDSSKTNVTLCDIGTCLFHAPWHRNLFDLELCDIISDIWSCSRATSDGRIAPLDWLSGEKSASCALRRWYCTVCSFRLLANDLQQDSRLPIPLSREESILSLLLKSDLISFGIEKWIATLFVFWHFGSSWLCGLISAAKARFPDVVKWFSEIFMSFWPSLSAGTCPGNPREPRNGNSLTVHFLTPT